MKKKRCVLLFDDKDQTNVINDIKQTLFQDFDLEFIFFRTSDAELKKDDSEDLDTDKLKTKIESEIKEKKVDVALTDFDLSCTYFNGFNVISMVHEIRNSIRFFIYSGNWNKVIRSIIEEYNIQESSEILVEKINELIHSNIIDCIKRTEYKDDLIKYLKKNCSDSMEQRLITLLREYGDMKFESCFPDFKGKTFAEIADMIEKKLDARTDEWIEAVLTQTIAYLTKVNQ